MKVSELRRLLGNMDDNTIVIMADGAEVLSVTASRDGNRVIISDEDSDEDEHIGAYNHLIFKMSIYVEYEDADELFKLEEAMDKAGLNLYREEGEQFGEFFKDARIYGYLVFDSPDWTLSADPDATECNGKLEVTIEHFMNTLVDYVQWKEGK